MECPNCGQHISPSSRRCGTCGKPVPPAQHLLEDCGLVPTSVPVEKAAVAGDWSEATCQIASLGDRMIATMLDAMLLAGASAVVSAWSFMRWGFARGAEFHLTGAALVISATLSAGISFAYLWLLEMVFGTTLGKTIVGIRVVRTSHSRLAASAIRNAMRIVDGMGFYLVGAMFAACSNRRQRLGDILAGTVVVEQKFRTSFKLLAVVLWSATLAGTGWGLPHICARKTSTHRPRFFGRSVVQLGYAEDSAYVCVSRLRVDVQISSAASAGRVASDSSLQR